MGQLSMEIAALTGSVFSERQQLLAPVGYIPPAEAEANYWRHLANQDSMAEA